MRAPNLCQGIHRFTAWLKQKARSKVARVTEFSLHCPAYSQAEALSNSEGRTNGLDGQSVSNAFQLSDLSCLRDHHTPNGGARNGLIAARSFSVRVFQSNGSPIVPKKRKTTTTTLTQIRINSSYSFPFKLLLPPPAA